MKKTKIFLRVWATSLMLVALMGALTIGAFAQQITFSDVTTDDWSYEYVMQVSADGIMNGTGEGRFSPRTAVTRAMVVTVLYRLEGEPDVDEGYSFEDVAGGSYYADAVKWAADNSIVNGTHEGTLGQPYFSPDKNISREELATMFLRYARFKYANVLLEDDLSSFTDADDVSAWAEEGIKWAVRVGLINGTGDGTFLSPAGEATREQFAAIICRFKEADIQYLPKHLFYDRRGKGKNVSLTGDVEVICIYVSDGESLWTDEEISDTYYDQLTALERLETEAVRYGAELDISLSYYKYESEEILTRNTYNIWFDKVIKGLGFDGRDRVNEQLCSMLECDEAVIVFCFDKEERSFAVSANYSAGTEYAVVYGSTTAESLCHEVCHIFGAYDYYYPAVIEDTAYKYFPDSVMLGGGNGIVDSLTAYLIGWADIMADDAIAFLTETSHLTKAEYDEAHRSEVITGYVEDYVGNGYVYTGYLKDGVMHGLGKITFDGGATYDGEWDNGRMHGKGILTWADGTCYEGDFVYNELTGQGTMRYADGDVYTGAFVDGVRDGYGEYVWVTGERYAGEWSNGQRHGYGVYTYRNGKKISGTWVNGTYMGN